METRYLFGLEIRVKNVRGLGISPVNDNEYSDINSSNNNGRSAKKKAKNCLFVFLFVCLFVGLKREKKQDIFFGCNQSYKF